tara:strand:- start:163 stop:390 length:228 start_codon:yes stop_codon:yes gene_type:complete
MNDEAWQERTDAWVKAQHEQRRITEMKRDFKTIRKKRNPVKKFMDKLHKPATHKDKSKYERKPKHSLDDETKDTT